ncbi:MAG: hypothetical protein C0497_05870 [Gemmatimonas sp.]|nr:hypothetical protein [Gemmatimonas sp.]
MSIFTRATRWQQVLTAADATDRPRVREGLAHELDSYIDEGYQILPAAMLSMVAGEPESVQDTVVHGAARVAAIAANARAFDERVRHLALAWQFAGAFDDALLVAGASPEVRRLSELLNFEVLDGAEAAAALARVEESHSAESVVTALVELHAVSPPQPTRSTSWLSALRERLAPKPATDGPSPCARAVVAARSEVRSRLVTGFGATAAGLHIRDEDRWYPPAARGPIAPIEPTEREALATHMRDLARWRGLEPARLDSRVRVALDLLHDMDRAQVPQLADALRTELRRVAKLTEHRSGALRQGVDGYLATRRDAGERQFIAQALFLDECDAMGLPPSVALAYVSQWEAAGAATQEHATVLRELATALGSAQHPHLIAGIDEDSPRGEHARRIAFGPDPVTAFERAMHEQPEGADTWPLALRTRAAFQEAQVVRAARLGFPVPQTVRDEDPMRVLPDAVYAPERMPTSGRLGVDMTALFAVASGRGATVRDAMTLPETSTATASGIAR